MELWKSQGERSITLGIDSYGDKNPVGQLWYGERECGLSFMGLMQLLLTMEGLLRDGAGPESKGPPRAPGKLGTFQVKVLFRQHESWQGTVTWVEGRKEQIFRSALELTMLLDNALTEIEHLGYGHIV